jgi:hypothetical protein
VALLLRTVTAPNFSRAPLLLVILPIAGVLLAAAYYQADLRRVNSRQVSGHKPEQRGTKNLLVASVSNFDFGTLATGGRQSTSFWLSNPGTTTVELSQITVSCDCLHVAVAKNRVAPGERILATAAVDFSDDPAWTGRLLLEGSAEAVGTNLPAFAISVKVVVQ